MKKMCSKKATQTTYNKETNLINYLKYKKYKMDALMGGRLYYY